MKTYTLTAYEFHELRGEAKEKVKEWYLSDPARSIDFRDIVLCDVSDYYKPIQAQVQFSLSSCQGDGVNIYGDFPVPALRDAFSIPPEFSGVWHPTYTPKEWKRLLHYSDLCGYAITIPYNTSYCFPMSSSIDFAEDWVYTLQENNYQSIDTALIKRFEHDLKAWHRSLCNYYILFGYEFLYNIEEDELAEMCDANQWFFDIDGNFLPGV